MSRSYQASLKVTGYNPERSAAIRNAVEEDCGHDDDLDPDEREYDGVNELNYYGFHITLCGGETEDEFTRRVARGIWKANNGPCTVETTIVDIENAPSDFNQCGAEEFAEDMQQYVCPDCGLRWYHPKGEPKECTCGAMVQEVPF